MSSTAYTNPHYQQKHPTGDSTNFDYNPNEQILSDEDRLGSYNYEQAPPIINNYYPPLSPVPPLPALPFGNDDE